MRSSTGKHSPHSEAEAAAAEEWRIRTWVLLTVLEGFALCFISSSQAMQAKSSEQHWCGASFIQHCCVLLLELLGYKEADENEATQSQGWQDFKGPISFWFLQGGKGELNRRRFLHFLKLESEPSVTQESF